MSITGRQNRFFKDTCDVYRISGYTKDSNNVVKQASYSTTKVYTSLRCRLQTTVFRNAEVNPLGRSQLDNFETEDKLHVELTTDLRDKDVVKITTSGSPYVNKYYVVIGKGEARIGWANYNHIRVRLLDTAPPGL